MYRFQRFETLFLSHSLKWAVKPIIKRREATLCGNFRGNNVTFTFLVRFIRHFNSSET